jgi:nucleoside-diphosphate-sugar epimerase
MTGRVAVTGANGFIGRNVVLHLRNAGWAVRAIVRPDRRYAVPEGVELVAAQFGTADLIRAAAGAEVIVHAAGRTRAATMRQFETANVEVTRQVVGAAVELGSRLVQVSSQAAAGPGTPERPRLEDDPPRPLTAYGRSKLAAEEVVKTSRRLHWTIVRPALVYGPFDRNALPLFKLAQRGIVPQASGSAAPAYTFVHVEDVARGIEAAATTVAAEGHTFSLGHPRSDTVDTLTDALERVLGRSCRRVRLPGAVLVAAALVGDAAMMCGRPLALDRARLAELRAEGWVCSVEKARDRLGFSARIDLLEGFASTAAWYARNGLLAKLP